MEKNIYTKDSILSLISRIHSLSQDFLQKKMEDEGLFKLATSHGNILFVLSRFKSLSLGELAEKINRDKSTATVLVRKLEKEGFIFMEKDSSDSRKKIIRLSEKGMKFNSATENLSRQLISSAFSSFSDNEKEELLSLLYRIYENLYDAV